jgi:hypothetical protein
MGCGSDFANPENQHMNAAFKFFAVGFWVNWLIWGIFDANTSKYAVIACLVMMYTFIFYITLRFRLTYGYWPWRIKK